MYFQIIIIDPNKNDYVTYREVNHFSYLLVPLTIMQKKPETNI